MSRRMPRPIWLLVAAPLCSHGAAQGESCYYIRDHVLHLRDDILNRGQCWVYATSARSPVEVSADSGAPVIRLTWRPCDYVGEGFRSEIAQNIRPFHRESQAVWGIENERRFPVVSYSWQFRIDDPDHLIGNWGGGSFIAQWHSGPRRSRLDRHLEGGSPVIGLYYTKDSGSTDSNGWLLLQMKVSPTTGYCRPSDKALPGPNPYCGKTLARMRISEGVFHDVQLSIGWDQGGKPGTVAALIDGQEMIPVDTTGKNGAYSYPNKQSAGPNVLRLGFYVQSRHKEQYRARAGVRARSDTLNELNHTLPFCNVVGSMTMTLRRFKVTAREDTESTSQDSN